jgi:hypothetical protein
MRLYLSDMQKAKHTYMHAQMEAKQALLEGELKDSQAGARKDREKLLHQLDMLDRQNTQLREQQGRMLRDQSAVAAQQAAQPRSDVTTLEEQLRATVMERDTVRGYLEELQGRHSMLQRSMQALEDQKISLDANAILGKKLQVHFCLGV